MRYQQADQQLFIKNRQKLSHLIEPGCLAVFTSNDILPTNADGILPFKQNSDFFYLTGIDQEDTLLIMYPAAANPAHREVLFIKETSDEIAIWEGSKLTPQEASKVSGITTVLWNNKFDHTLRMLMLEGSGVYLNANEHLRADVKVQTAEMRLATEIKNQYPLHTIKRAAPLMHRLRVVKEQAETETMQRACNITHNGFNRVLNFVKPGVNEYQIEAEYLHEFVSSGSRGFAYQPIIAAGYNACVLHYVNNDQICADGDLILMDVGAEYGNYNADMTRTIPVSGRFTDRQKQVYNAVLNVMRQAIAKLVPGNLHTEYTHEVGMLMQEELIKLGLLTANEVKNHHPNKPPLYKKYFMHGVSHHIGLDVHDVGSFNRPFEPNMVLSCEPGIYIRDENIGIRLENLIQITDNGNFDLMADIPLEADHIEEIMLSGK